MKPFTTIQEFLRYIRSPQRDVEEYIELIQITCESIEIMNESNRRSPAPYKEAFLLEMLSTYLPLYQERLREARARLNT